MHPCTKGSIQTEKRGKPFSGLSLFNLPITISTSQPKVPGLWFQDLTKKQHNDIVVLMIPDLIDIGAPWKMLPLGVHDATLEEVRAYFATNPRRKALFKGLSRACKSLKSAGCTTIFLDGSYVTAKSLPGDFDVCWDPTGVDPAKLDPVFMNFDDRRKKQKSKYGGEFFPSSALADGSHTFVEYFQKDKETGFQKGIIRIHLSHRKARH